MNQRKHTPQKRIIRKQWRGRWPISPWLLYLLSIPLILVGLFCLALSIGILPLTIQAPGLLIAMFGFYFVFGGLVSIYLASQPGNRKTRLDSTSPYQSDYPWSLDGISEDMESPIEKTFLGAVILSGILVPIHTIAWGMGLGDGAERILVFVVFGLFDLILLAHILTLVSFGWQRLRFGKTYMRFRHFPFFTGQTLTVTFEGGNRLKSRRLSATLRCIEERIKYSSKYDEEGQIVCTEVYADEQNAVTDAAGRVSISFSVPSDLPGTKLKEDLPTYWEMVIESVSSGTKFKRVFLIPVYGTRIDNRQ